LGIEKVKGKFSLRPFRYWRGLKDLERSFTSHLLGLRNLKRQTGNPLKCLLLLSFIWRRSKLLGSVKVDNEELL